MSLLSIEYDESSKFEKQILINEMVESLFFSDELCLRADKICLRKGKTH